MRMYNLKVYYKSILKATHRESESAIVGEHIGIGTAEVEVAWVGATKRTAPIEAAGPNNEERTTAAGAVARHGQFKRRGKSPFTTITDPTCALGIHFGFGW